MIGVPAPEEGSPQGGLSYFAAVRAHAAAWYNGTVSHLTDPMPMRRHPLLAAAVVALLFAGAGCVFGPAPAPSTPPPAPSPVEPPAAGAQAFGTPVTLLVGAAVTFEDGLNVTLLSVGDSRCPEGVQCIWQGELSPVLQLLHGGIGDIDKQLTLGTVRAAKATLGGYAFALTGAAVDSATFVVTKSDAGAVKDEMIDVATPHEGDVVSSPLTVRGEARGAWYFEAQFPVRLLDADGRVLASAPAHATGDWMTDQMVPFEATLTFDRPAAVTGTLVLEKDNPSDLPQNADSRSIPVRFGTGVPPTGGTGVRGTVTIGPTCPVERMPPDPGCAPKPYATTLRVTTPAGKAVAVIDVGADGAFSRQLAPGDYVIGPAGTATLPRLAPQPFTVKAGVMTALDLVFDSGIR